jgi:hypothetical protein
VTGRDCSMSNQFFFSSSSSISFLIESF